MNENLEKKKLLVIQFIDDYRTGKSSLNSLIQNIEAVSGFIENEKWKKTVFAIVIDLEQINAALIEGKESLSASDTEIISDSLRKLTELVREIFD